MRERSDSLYYCVVALVQGHDLYHHNINIHTMETAWEPTWLYIVSTVKHEYDSKGQALGQELLYSTKQVIKTFLYDIGMAVPKITETRCRMAVCRKS